MRRARPVVNKQLRVARTVNKKRTVKKFNTPKGPLLSARNTGCLPAAQVNRLPCDFDYDTLGVLADTLVLHINTKKGKVPDSSNNYNSGLVYFYLYRILLWLSYKRGQYDSNIAPIPPDVSSYPIPYWLVKIF
jgi:hypothetical protein